MKKKNTSKMEKSTVRDYMWAMKGTRIPIIPLIMILAAALLSTYAGLNISLFTGGMVDAQGDVPTNELVKYAVSYLLIGLAAAIQLIAVSVASEKINLGLRTRLWRKIMHTSLSNYEADCGESLVSRITSDCDYSSKLLTTAVEIVSIMISLCIYYVKMHNLNPTLAISMIWLAPISVLIGWGYAKLSFIFGQKTQATLAATTTYLVERTQNLNLIKTSNSRKEEIQMGLENFDEQYKMQIKNGLLNLVYTSLQHIYNILSLLIPFIVGAKLVNDGVIRAGVVIAFYSIATSVGTIATNIIQDIGTIRNANGAISRVIGVLKLPDEETTSGLPMDSSGHDITIRELSFSYGDKKVLDNVNCLIPKNKITAIIGPNGSGKSTLFSLLDRLNRPQEGSVGLGEHNAEEYNLHEWRRAFCLVAQDSPMLEGTIRENICYGCERDVSDAELTEVAKLSHVYDFVSKLPDGFDTKVMLGGANFSGGQRQCIAIARAMMNNPQYLLLDEATSSLDAQSEHMVLDALRKLMHDRTTVIIAHSLAAIRNADNVIVLRNGTVESTGTPSSILQKADNYLAKVVHRRDG